MRVQITIDEAGEGVSVERLGADGEIAGADEAIATGATGGLSAGRVGTGRGGFNPAGLPEIGPDQRARGVRAPGGAGEQTGLGGRPPPATAGAGAPGTPGVGEGGAGPQSEAAFPEEYPLGPRQGMKPSTIDLYVGNQM